MYNRNTYQELPIGIEQELKMLFNSYPASIIFEIGACEGEDTIKYARLFDGSVIHCFEPRPDNVELIKANLSKFSGYQVHVHQMALSDRDGIADLHVSSGQPENVDVSDWDFGNKSSSLLKPGQHLVEFPSIKFEQLLQVPTRTLLSFCEEHGITAIDFIHIDVQGAELMVFKGAGKMLCTTKVIWLEVSSVEMYKGQPLADEVDRYLSAAGFVLVKDELSGAQGDRLYLSSKAFPDHAVWKRKIAGPRPPLTRRLIDKFRSFFLGQ